jgi:hypothetical protein
MRGLAAVVGSTLAIAACGVDQVAAPNTPALTTAQLAVAFDSLAGTLPTGDARIHWLQQIDNAMAFGAARTPIEIDVAGQTNLYWAVATATIATLDTTGPVRSVDSTYVLVAWQGAIVPFDFLELDITFARRAYAQPDTAEAHVAYFPSDTASGLVGESVVAATQNTVIQGDCTPVTLVHLALPTGHCALISTQMGYQSSIAGMPFRAVLGARLTPTS